MSALHPSHFCSNDLSPYVCMVAEEQARLEPKSVVVQDEALADEDRAQGPKQCNIFPDFP